MAGMTIAGQKASLDWFVTQYPFIALCTSAPTDTAAGTEATYTGYARKQTVTADWAPATDAVPSVKANTTTLAWPQCTAGSATCTHVEFWSAATGGVRGGWGAMAQPLAVSAGIAPQAAPGIIQVTQD